MWEQAGMHVTTQATDQTQFITQAVLGNYQANLWRQFGAVDPDTDALWWYSTNTGTGSNGGLALNIARNRDPQIDAALNKGRQSTYVAVRKAAYDKFQQRFAVDAPYILDATSTIWAIVAGRTPCGASPMARSPTARRPCRSAAAVTSAAWSVGPSTGFTRTRPSRRWRSR